MHVCDIACFIVFSCVDLLCYCLFVCPFVYLRYCMFARVYACPFVYMRVVHLAIHVFTHIVVFTYVFACSAVHA